MGPDENDVQGFTLYCDGVPLKIQEIELPCTMGAGMGGELPRTLAENPTLSLNIKINAKDLYLFLCAVNDWKPSLVGFIGFFIKRKIGIL